MAWAAAMAAAWLVLVGAAPVAEVLGGVAAGAIVAFVAHVVRDETKQDLRVRARWLRVIAPLPWRIAKDTVRLAGVLARSLSGREVAGEIVRAGGYEGEGAEAVGRRAMATIAASMSPGTVVIEIEGGALVAHALPKGAGSGLGWVRRALA